MGFFDVDDRSICHMDLNNDGRRDIIDDYIFFESTNSNRTDEDSIDDLDFSDLNSFELEDMDADERREALEDAGIDPDDFDDLDF